MNSFYTDVIVKSPQFKSDTLYAGTDLLYPPFFTHVEALIADAEAQGHKLNIIETYRSQARQEELFKQGATKLQHVGVHGFGLACDIVFLKPDGTPNWQADYSVLRDLAHKHQLISGYDWGNEAHPSFRDSDHLQMVSLKEQPHLFNGTWYPAADYNPYDNL